MIKKKFLITFSFLFLSCATYQSKISSSKNLTEEGYYLLAANEIKNFAEQSSDDQLAFLLDYASLLFYSGEYKESIQAFLKAEAISEESDYFSVSRQTGSVFVNEEMLKYQTPVYEKILINVYLALNFIELNQYDEALVEIRKIHQKYLKLKSEEVQPFELNSLGKYLSAILWEMDKKYDLAYLSLKESFEIDPNIHGIETDLIRLAFLAQRDDEALKLMNQFNLRIDKKSVLDSKSSKKSQLLIFVHSGQGPQREQSGVNSPYPILVPHSYYKMDHRFEIDNQVKKSQVIFDLETAAIRSLKEEYDYLVKKRLASFVAKEVLAEQIRQKDEALGLIALIFMRVSERADLRQWSQLPQTVQLVRFELEPGDHELKYQDRAGKTLSINLKMLPGRNLIKSVKL